MARAPVFPLTEKEAIAFRSGFNEGEDGDCWPWRRATISTGYGECWVGGRVVLAHRVSWALKAGRDIPDGAVIRHSCDNPPCVNPRHLEVGGQRENWQDSKDRGRASPPPRHSGETHPMAKLTDAQVAEIIASPDSPTALSQRYGVTANRIQAIWRKNGRFVGKPRGPYKRATRAART